MQQQPELYHLMRNLDVAERKTTPDMLIKGPRVLVSEPILGNSAYATSNDNTGAKEIEKRGMADHLMRQ